ncbi:1,4-dihydroxy-6-naphthoate synthase [Vibrio phage Ceto]|uniref:1,4-dihydroxy-6-naphthoate synthase n=1 Tax=Vibrio phage Ceto TaxID=2570300 RepID=A0A2H5BGC0_9CAUD|nr:1,4-dihydroxy-6-naphthoate synthase [Vibrio phage Ceto]AUG85037.1 1,4-dihydroxy-6-naphthoate synthase [Vibrio phage Ceto]
MSCKPLSALQSMDCCKDIPAFITELLRILFILYCIGVGNNGSPCSINPEDKSIPDTLLILLAVNDTSKASGSLSARDTSSDCTAALDTLCVPALVTINISQNSGDIPNSSPYSYTLACNLVKPANSNSTPSEKLLVPNTPKLNVAEFLELAYVYGFAFFECRVFLEPDDLLKVWLKSNWVRASNRYPIPL